MVYIKDNVSVMVKKGNHGKYKIGSLVLNLVRHFVVCIVYFVFYVLLGYAAYIDVQNQ